MGTLTGFKRCSTRSFTAVRASIQFLHNRHYQNRTMVLFTIMLLSSIITVIRGIVMLSEVSVILSGGGGGVGPS